MIEVKNLCKNFEGFWALDHCNLYVKKGAVYGLVGPNGSGKTTLIRHLAGVYHQDEGDLFVGQQPVYENTKIKQTIAYIPDDLYTFPQANVTEMARFYRSVYPKFDLERFNRLSEVFQIDKKKNIRRLSKGMQKQVAFWLMACIGADVFLLDEPVDGLDPVMRRTVWSILLQDVAERGTTVLVSSHNLRELEDVCDHVGIMHKGKVVLERSLSDMQGNITKIQVVAQDGKNISVDFPVLHKSDTGKISTYIVRGTQEQIIQALSVQNPLLLEALPLTLEEIFIYELGGMDYEVSNILF